MFFREVYCNKFVQCSGCLVLLTKRSSALKVAVLSGTESRIANRTIPRIAGRNRQKFRNEKQNNESNRGKVESRKIDSESPSESHPNNA